MTQADLARRLKKSKGSVCEYESGNHTPPLDVLRTIARVLETPLEELLA